MGVELMRGAEAILKNSTIFEWKILVKERIQKAYRISELDEKLRKQRTKQEARLLHKAKIAGVDCPTVLFVEKFKIGMSKINGKRPKMTFIECVKTGELAGKLHNENIIHGDFVPSNLIKTNDKIYVIDFGLGSFSTDIEDKAIDVFTMLKSLGNIKKQIKFLDGYKKTSKEYEKINNRIEEIKKRVRYA